MTLKMTQAVAAVFREHGMAKRLEKLLIILAFSAIVVAGFLR
jgi:hypothetical protein